MEYVRFGGSAENADAETAAVQISLPERDARLRIQRLDISKRKKDPLSGGFDIALLAHPEPGEEMIRIFGGADESLLLRAETAAEQRIAHAASALQIQADGMVRYSTSGEGAAVGKAEMIIGVHEIGLALRL